MVADGGTIVEMAAMNRILEITDDYVRVQAGAALIDVAKALEQRGLQLPVNPDLGNLTMGAAALAPTKDSSMPGKSASSPRRLRRQGWFSRTARKSRSPSPRRT